MNLAPAWSKIRSRFSTPIAWVLLGGFLIRIYSAVLRTIVNPDGTQYIYQASALFNQDWSSVLSCKLTYLSPLPIFITAAFTVCGDWIVAAQMVNVIFGWATLLPLYYVLRRFFERGVCTITVLIYALMPVFVDGSGNVIRGPMFWFCLLMGMLFFIRQWDEIAKANRFRYDLLFSMLFFLLATWCRIEGVVFLAAPWAYLCFTRTDRKLQRCLFFSIPLVSVGLAAIGAALVSGADVGTALRLKQVLREATQFTANFDALDTWIRDMQTKHGGLYGEFLRRSREVLGLIPVIVIFQNIMEGVFYPFALVFFAGFFGIRRQYRQNRRTAYFLWQVLAGLLVLYVHTLQTWVVSYRFLAVFILPGCVLMAGGVEKVVGYLRDRRQWLSGKAVALVSAAIVVLALPKNLKPEERDKAVYRQAAAIMTRQGTPAPLVSIAGFRRTRALEWILLYSRRNAVSIPCSQSLRGVISPDYSNFVANLDKAGIRYLLYEERFWPHQTLDLPSIPFQNDFRLLGQWQHPDSKKFILFERLGN